MQLLRRLFLPIAGTGALALACLLYLPSTVLGSDHQDTTLTAGRPGADITDVFLFPAADPNNVVLAMDVHPLIPAGQGTTAFFDPGIMYQLKIDASGDYREDYVIQFRAVGTGENQRIEMYGPAKPAMVGTRSTWAGSPQSFEYNKPFALANGVKAFAGPRQDPFYFDLAQFFKIIPDRNQEYHAAGSAVPAANATCFRKPGVDFLENYNVLSFVVELPRRMLAARNGKPGMVHVYATTSEELNGAWTQVERLGRPAIKEAFEPFDRHDTTNRSSPWADPLLPGDITAFMTSPRGAHRSSELASAVRKVLIPDELQANLAASGPARYLAVETKGKTGLPTGVVRIVPDDALKGLKKSLQNGDRLFGGRDPSSPVIDLSLGIIFGSLGQKVGLAADDSRETPCLTSDNVQPPARGVTATFPYIGNAI